MSILPYEIAPSLLAANFFNLEKDLSLLSFNNINTIHFDVMDNHYVPNLSFGPVVCDAIKKYLPSLSLDVHLMVQPADALIESFAASGAEIITIHPDSVIHLDRSLKRIKELGCKAGLAFNPATPLHQLETVIDQIDLVLLMSVNPGFGGQTFIKSVLPKIEKARTIINKSGKPIRLQVDGGINLQTISDVADAGADSFVIGSALFQSDNYPDIISDYWNILNSK